MCEFKIIRKNDGSQIGEDILVLSYTEDDELVFKDVLGMGEKLHSALIYDVNTLNQTCLIMQHPLVNDFIGIIRNFNENKLQKSQVENFQNKLDELKESI